MGTRQAQASKVRIWRDHLARHAASGKSIIEFCRTETISQGNFYAWRTKLRGGAEPPFHQTGYALHARIQKLSLRPNPHHRHGNHVCDLQKPTG